MTHHQLPWNKVEIQTRLCSKLDVQDAILHIDIHIIEPYGYLMFDFWHLLLKSLLDFLLVFLSFNKVLTPGAVIWDASYRITTKR